MFGYRTAEVWSRTVNECLSTYLRQQPASVFKIDEVCSGGSVCHLMVSLVVRDGELR